MAELAAAFSATVLAPLAAESAVATTAAASTAAAAGSTLSLGSIISGSLAAGSGIFATLAGLSAAETRAEGQRLQAEEAEAEARQEQNQSLDRQRRIRAAAVKALGESDIAYAASGIDLGFGDAAQSRGRIMDEAQSELSIDREGALSTASQYYRRGAIFRRMASETKNAGYLTAAANLFDTGYKIARRG